MKTTFLVFFAIFFTGTCMCGILLAQPTPRPDLHILEKIDQKEKALNQPQGELLKILNLYHVVGKERKIFFKDLKGKYVWDKNDEDEYLEELAKEKPTVVSAKLNDGRIALAISFPQFQGIFTSVFLSVNGKMTYIETLSKDAKYKSFKPMFAEGHSKLFVFLGNQTNSGTGVASYDYDIYQIVNNKLVSLGSIPLEGFENEWHNYLTIDYKSEFEVVKSGLKDVLQVKVKYKFGIDVFEFTTRGGCITDKTPDSDFFLFNDELVFDYDLQYFPKGNEETKTIFERNCNSATTELENPVFITNHFEKLKFLAKQGKKSQKCWLRELLKDKEIKKMKDQQYRKELLAILNGNN